MAKVSLDLFSMSIVQKIEMSQRVVRSLKGNPYFYHYPLPIDDLSLITQRLETSLSAGKKNTADYDLLQLIDLEESMESLLLQIAKDIERISRGNSVLISSSGFEVDRVSKEMCQLRKVEKEIKKESGEVNLSWKRVYGAKAYLIEISSNPDDPKSWKKIGHTFRSQYYLLQPGLDKKYFIRISVIDEKHNIVYSNIQQLSAA